MNEMMAGISKAYDDGLAQLCLADARDMSFLEDESVDCIVTSPPYYSLRVWGEGADTVWDGDPECDHVWGQEIRAGGRAGQPWASESISDNIDFPGGHGGQFCQLCGAWRGQLGLEPTIELYLNHLLQILDVECRRVLKDSGVMVVNMGDSYDSLQMSMIPARFALAMQQRGWYMRSIVPWLKQAAMPDSIQGDRWERHRVKIKPVWSESNPHPSKRNEGIDRLPHSGELYATYRAEWADCPGCPKCLPNDGLVRRKGNWRPGRSMEWLFLFSKTNDYYSDAEGVRLEAKRAGDIPGGNKQGIGQYGVSSGWAGGQVPGGRNRRQSDWLYESLDAIIANHEREARRLKHLRDNGGVLWENGEPLALLLNPKGYKGAHFATYPIAMVEPLIKAYTSEKGNCPKCGRAWVRVVERSTTKPTDNMSQIRADQVGKDATFIMPIRYETKSSTLGWRPDCDCDAGEPVTAVVCDPFVGSGTTCAAATKLGRRSIGVDCVEEYIKLAIKRLGGPFTVQTKEGVKVRQEGLFQ